MAKPIEELFCGIQKLTGLYTCIHRTRLMGDVGEGQRTRGLEQFGFHVPILLI